MAQSTVFKITHVKIMTRDYCTQSLWFHVLRVWLMSSHTVFTMMFNMQGRVPVFFFCWWKPEKSTLVSCLLIKQENIWSNSFDRLNNISVDFYTHCHKTFDYNFCARNWIPTNQNTVSITYRVLTGQFWSTSSKLVLDSFMIIRPDLLKSINNLKPKWAFSRPIH
jgi:hypothetical protein